MINPNTEIFRLGLPGRFLYFSEFVPACCQKFGEKFSGERWPETLILFKDKRILWINEYPALRKAGKELFLKYIIKEEVRKEIYRKWLQSIDVLVSFQNKLDKINLKEITNSELGKLWTEFFELTVCFWSFTIPCELGGYGSDEVLKKELEKYIKTEEELKLAMEILAAPEETSFYLAEEIDLAETKDVKSHQQKYFWLHNSYAGTKILTLNYFSKRKYELKNNLRYEIEQKLKQVKQEKEKIILQHQLPPKVIAISQAISQVIVWQDQRKKYILMNLHYKDLLLKEVARRFNYERDDLLNAWFTEIEKIILGENLRNILLARRDGFGVYFDKTVKDFLSKEALSFWNTYASEKISKKVNEFSGTLASKGNESFIQGKVRIVFDPFQAKNFQKGEILVAPMTSPEYVFLMEKAAAIITDTGGLTCHAAIVSREFEIPCIVGTKIATQILKDGDVVKIDAAKGTVKIVKKAK